MRIVLFGAAKERARRDLEKTLYRIYERLDALETAPPSHLTRQDIQAASDLVRAQLDERLGGVETRFDALESLIEEHHAKIKTLTYGVEEGIQRTDRAERRIHATVKRARKELAEHGYESAGLEGEAAELRLVDGGGSEEHGVLTVSEGVEPPLEAPSSVPGVSAEALRRARGF